MLCAHESWALAWLSVEIKESKFTLKSYEKSDEINLRKKQQHRIKYKTRGQNTNLNELLVRFGGDLQNAWDRNALKGIEKNLIFI